MYRRWIKPLRLKNRRSPNKVLTCESLRQKALSRDSRRHGVTSPAKEPKNPVKVLTSKAEGMECIIKTRGRRGSTLLHNHHPCQSSEGGVALRKTDTRTTPVMMNEPNGVCNLARAKGGWRFAAYICAQSKDKCQKIT